MTTTLVPESPAELGLPSKFSDWREGQERAIETILTSPQKYIVQGHPTGSGKSVIYVGAALASGLRVLVLTNTKALQDQLMADFGAVGMVAVKGKNAYQCIEDLRYSVDTAHCNFGYACPVKSECHYYAQLNLAKRAKLVVTNYHFWMSANKYMEEGIGDFDLIVMDEAHECFNCLTGFLRIEIDSYLVKQAVDTYTPRNMEGLNKWKYWAKNTKGLAQTAYAKLCPEGKVAIISPAKAEKINLLRGLLRICEEILNAEGEWVCTSDRGKVYLDPIKVGKNSTQYLFGNSGKILFTSATISRELMELLSIPEHEYLFEEYPSSFPADRHPIQHIYTMKMSYRSSQSDLINKMVAKVDEIIEGRLDRKGIIHTVSYDRAKIIVENSKFSSLMFTHTQGGTEKSIQEFRETHSPAVLVSPSVQQGYDFPGDLCRYQILVKVPFPVLNTPVMKARVEQYPRLVDYITMQKLVQSCGRGMRSPDDFCETFILDDNWCWWWEVNADLAPEWFSEGVVPSRVVPRKALNLS